MALEQDVDALVDAGSLLAGVLNQEAAKYLASRFDSLKCRFRGIIYFKSSSYRRGGQWMVSVHVKAKN